MGDLLQLIRDERIPAPAPIEQRWTSSSRSPMSPAASNDQKEVFSWVGIIMYLPTLVEAEREAITKSFFGYRAASAKALWDKYGAVEHWAKIEVLETKAEKEWVRDRLRKRFGVDELNKKRLEMDPKNILANPLIDALLPRTDSEDDTHVGTNVKGGEKNDLRDQSQTGSIPFFRTGVRPDREGRPDR